MLVDLQVLYLNRRQFRLFAKIATSDDKMIMKCRGQAWSSPRFDLFGFRFHLGNPVEQAGLVGVGNRVLLRYDAVSIEVQ